MASEAAGGRLRSDAGKWGPGTPRVKTDYCQAHTEQAANGQLSTLFGPHTHKFPRNHNFHDHCASMPTLSPPEKPHSKLRDAGSTDTANTKTYPPPATKTMELMAISEPRLVQNVLKRVRTQRGFTAKSAQHAIGDQASQNPRKESLLCFCHIYRIHWHHQQQRIHSLAEITCRSNEAGRKTHAHTDPLFQPPDTPYDRVGALAAHGAQLLRSAVTSLRSTAPGAVPLLSKK